MIRNPLTLPLRHQRQNKIKEKTCQLLADRVLNRSFARNTQSHDAALPLPKIPFQPSKTSITVPLPPDEASDEKVKVARAWTLPAQAVERWDAYETLKGKVLSSLLLNGPVCVYSRAPKLLRTKSRLTGFSNTASSNLRIFD